MTIIQYKEFNNLTHEDMAKLLKISLPYYYKIINGSRKPSRQLLTHIKKNIPEIDINIFLE